MSNGLVLSLFPGADLLGSAFEESGWCVVRGPDILFGGDVRNFTPAAGCFAGVIGGPPCQPFSNASCFNGTKAVDLVGEFVRVVEQARPQWVVMENVPALKEHPAIPAAWHRSIWCDWDCGGATKRERAIWTWPFAIQPPAERPGYADAEWSLCASQWKVRTGIKNGGTRNMHQTMTVEKAGRLQGAESLAARLENAWPAGVSAGSRRCLVIHMLGNGVPRPMGLAIARAINGALGIGGGDAPPS